MPEYPEPVRTEYKLLAKYRQEVPRLTYGEIATRMGVAESTVGFWLRRVEYQRYENWLLEEQYTDLPVQVQRNIQDVKEAFQAHAAELQERLFDLIETTPSDKVRLAAIQDALDRAGLVPVRKAETRGLQLVLTPEVLQMLRERANEAGVLVETVKELTE